MYHLDKGLFLEESLLSGRLSDIIQLIEVRNSHDEKTRIYVDRIIGSYRLLAAIALIATPLVLNIIERTEKGAFRDSVYGIMESH